MNKKVKLAFAAAAAMLAVSTASYAQKADPSKGSGYVVGAEQNVVKSGFGLCWRTGYFTFAAEALFDFDKSVVKPEGRARLDDLVGKIKGITLEVVIAVGHTDAIGTDAYNQRLSVRRAEAVKAYLVSKGIPANRIYTEGKGKKQPVADNRTAAGRAKNRRVEVEVVGTRPRS